MKHFILIALVFAATTMSAQKDSVMVEIAADTLSSDMQEGGISVEALNLYNQGLTYADRDMPDSAIVYFTLALDSNPDFGKALYNRSSAYLKMENYPSALIDIDRYLEVVDTASFGYYTRAAILEELNRDDDAISAYRQAIDRGDKVEESQRSLAKIFLEREEFQKAVDHFTAYLRYDPSNAFALHDRATAYLLLNDLTAAERDYRQAAMVNNEFASAYANLGSVLRKQKRYKEAVAAYTQALTTEEDALIFNNRGFAYYLDEDYESAVADFQKAIELAPDYAYAHNNLASAYIRMEKFEEAVDAATKAISINPEYGYAYLNRGIAREMVRDLRGACEDWEKAEAMNIPNATDYLGAVCKFVEP